MTDSGTSTIGVVIPTYNRPEFLQEAVDSVLAQSCPPDVLVVVDDGSTTDLPPSILELASTGRLTLVRQANGGVARAMNRGATEVATDYILFTGDDDVLVPGALAGLRQALDEDPAVVMAAGGARNWYMPEGRLGPLEFPDVQRGDFDELLTGCPYFAGAVMIRRSAFVAVGGFETAVPLSEDWDLYLRLARLGPTALPTVPAMHYRRHAVSMTGSMRVARMAVCLGWHYLRMALPSDRARQATLLGPGLVRRFLRQVAWHGQQALKAGRLGEASRSAVILWRLIRLGRRSAAGRQALREEWAAY
jgi:glycosyltransferase involved in cell wall biosynthesis